METMLIPGLKQARLNLALGTAIFAGAALAAQALSARAEIDRDAVYPQTEVAASIARQGNEAVRRIREDARERVNLAQPASLSELAGLATDVAVK